MRPDYVYGPLFLVAAIALSGAAFRGGWMIALLWPAISCLLISTAYWTGRVSLFGKKIDGSRHPIAMGLLLPYLMLAYIVWRINVFLTREPFANVVNDSLVVGRRPLAGEIPEKVSIVCDLTSEFSEVRTIRSLPGYRCRPILDASSPLPQELLDLVMQLSPIEGTRVFIHCAKGHGRTGVVAAAWLIAHGYSHSVDDALQKLTSARPGIELRGIQRQSLESILPLLVQSK